MINVLERPPTEYGLYFLIPASGYLLGSFISAKLSRRLGIDRMILLGATLALAFAVVPVLFTASGLWIPAAFFLPMAMVTLSNGIAVPSAQSGAVSAVPEATGTASSMISFMQQAAGAVIIQLVGILQNGTPWPMVTVVLISAMLSFVGAMLLRRRNAPLPRIA
jgi:DHA1 family bicyclomycin/chloramphenicol resistance-like MFS transporter